jgi:hypothetical protein
MNADELDLASYNFWKKRQNWVSIHFLTLFENTRQRHASQTGVLPLSWSRYSYASAPELDRRTDYSNMQPGIGQQT